MTDFLETQRQELETTLRALGEDSEQIKAAANRVLELSAKTLAAKLLGHESLFAERAVPAAMANLKAAASVQAASAVASFVEGALLRIAASVGRTLLVG